MKFTFSATLSKESIEHVERIKRDLDINRSQALDYIIKEHIECLEKEQQSQKQQRN